MDTIWVETLLILVAILANGFFAGSEIALVSARPARLAQLRDEQVAGAATALALKREPETMLATAQIAITLVGTLASAVGGATAIEALTPWLERLPLPGAPQWGEPVALGLVILAITYVSLVVGELVPKALALRDPERAACRVARPIQTLIRAAAWPSRLLTASTRAVLAVIGQRDAPVPPKRRSGISCGKERARVSSSPVRVRWWIGSSRSRTPSSAPSWCRAPRSWPWIWPLRPVRP